MMDYSKRRSRWEDSSRWVSIVGDIACIQLAAERGVAIVSVDDFSLVRHHKWSIHRSKDKFYARTSGNIYLHRLILGDADPREIDHINGCGLDCRRSNLRWATRPQNMANMHRKAVGSSSYRGVSKRETSHGNIWVAQVSDQVVGSFANEISAAVAYDNAAIKKYGSFAVLNFPTETPQ